MITTGCASESSSPVASTLFVSDYQASAIVQYDGATGAFERVFAAGSVQRVDRPARVRLGPAGALFSAGFGRSDIVRYAVTSGEMMDIFYWDTGLLEEPVQLRFDGDDLIVLGNDTANAVVISPDGVARRSFGNPVMRAAHDFAIGAERQLYVATDSHPQLGSAVQVWDLATGALLRHFGTIDEVATATSVALDHDGVLYVADGDLDRVVRFDPGTGALLDVFAAGFSRPISIDFGPDGAFYVLDAIGLHGFDATGARLGQLIAVGDGHLLRPRSFTFVADVALAP